MESEDRKKEIESKCRLGLDVGRYLEDGEFKLKTEQDARMKFMLYFNAISPLDLIEDIGGNYYVCKLYQRSPDPTREFCKACPLYSKSTNGKLGDEVYHPQSLVVNKDF